jgi:hypothetical protein
MHEIKMCVMTAIAAIVIERAQKTETVWTNSRRPVSCVMFSDFRATCCQSVTTYLAELLDRRAGQLTTQLRASSGANLP